MKKEDLNLKSDVLTAIRILERREEITEKQKWDIIDVFLRVIKMIEQNEIKEKKNERKNSREN